MLKKLRNHKSDLTILTILVVFLILVRLYEDILFYDPFLDYFKMDYTNLPLPEMNSLKMFFGLLLRYFINTILSLAIIYTVFKDFELTKFASLLYLILFVGLIFAFFLILSFDGGPNKMTLFYIRRFLIQPLFLLVFLPAFYYQKQNK